MKISFTGISLALLASVALTLGCAEPQKNNPAGGAEQQSDHGHGDHDHGDHGHGDHDHGDHDHDDHDHPPHGPNHGHIIKLDSPGILAEWCKFKDNNVIKMHILSSGMNRHAMKVDSFVVTSSVGEGQVFQLQPENVDAEGKASTYMLDDQDLCIAIPMGVKIEIKMGDKIVNGTIEAHKPRDH